MTPQTREKWLAKANNLAYRLSQKRKQSKARIIFIWIFIVFAFLCFSGYVLIKIGGWRYNTSDSMKTGFYRAHKNMPIKSGATVEVCLPNKVAKIAYLRGYLQTGSCPDGIEPLVKKIIGIPGDIVSVDSQGMSVNGLFYAAPQHKTDSKGRALTPIHLNNKRIEGYLLYGANNPDKSWDSRYYGVVPRSSIQSGLSYEG